MGARSFNSSSASSIVTESLPPESATATRSPSRIILKRVTASPTLRSSAFSSSKPPLYGERAAEPLLQWNYMANLYDLDPGPETPEVIRMIVEIPQNSANKYEYDGKLGVFRLDRPLYSPLHYPGDYGFVPGTIADDGDPLDVLTLMS